MINEDRSARHETLLRRIAYALFAAIAAAVVALRLGPALLAGLFSFMVLDLTYRLLSAGRVPRILSRWMSLLLLILAVVGGAWILAAFARDALSTVPDIAIAAVPKVAELAQRYGVPLPFESALDLRDVLLKTLGENLPSLTQATGIMTAETLRLLIGAVVAVLYFMTIGKPREEVNLYGRLCREFSAVSSRFMEGFEKVLGAQVVIAAINTLVTAAYLLWIDLPHAVFLILATFVLGIIPIVGNVASNFLIIGTALTVSPRLAVLSLWFLVFIHTLEHFLNSRIIGGRIEAPMWLTLLSILVGEIVMGVPGILLAPTIIHFVREELRTLPAPQPAAKRAS